MKQRLLIGLGALAALAALGTWVGWAATLGIYPTIVPLAGTDMLKTYLHGQPVTTTGTNFVNTFNDVWRFGHTGTVPVLTTCGTNPAITGTDAGGAVTFGTGSPTACTITFASTWTVTPDCVVTWQSNLASMTYTPAPTTLTLGQTATSSDVVNYYCRPAT